VKHELSLRERALKFLAQREHSRRELAAKLAPHAESPEELQTLLDALASKRQLSDERYAEARARALSRKYGAARIVHDLKAKGVAPELAEHAAEEAWASESQRARDALRKKFGAPPQSRNERARQIRFLQSRGFSFDSIRSALGGGEDAD
jgi:regulatory protein